VVVSLQEPVMNHTSQQLASPSMRPSAAFAGDLAAELHRFDEQIT
jgi:hypothetical protein